MVMLSGVMYKLSGKLMNTDYSHTVYFSYSVSIESIMSFSESWAIE